MTKQQRRKPGETRERLMNAALALVGEGRHFSSLGIRELTRKAGVVPTAFYRHFRHMDDLGLQLVDELGLALRRVMREARANVGQSEKLIDESVAIFINHARDNRNVFLFMAQGLAGESRAVHEGVRSEMRFFTMELANDLRRLRLVDHLSDADMEITCDLVVRTVAFSLTDLLGVSPEDDYQIQQIEQRTARFLKLIFIGAEHWKSRDR